MVAFGHKNIGLVLNIGPASAAVFVLRVYSNDPFYRRLRLKRRMKGWRRKRRESTVSRSKVRNNPRPTAVRKFTSVLFKKRLSVTLCRGNKRGFVFLINVVFGFPSLFPCSESRRESRRGQGGRRGEENG